MANCKGHDKEKLVYSFPAGESMHDQMRADICHSLFGTQQESTFLGLLRFNESNEATVYNSLYWDSFEHANATNTSAMAKNFLNDNPSSETEFPVKSQLTGKSRLSGKWEPSKFAINIFTYLKL